AAARAHRRLRGRRGFVRADPFSGDHPLRRQPDRPAEVYSGGNAARRGRACGVLSAGAASDEGGSDDCAEVRVIGSRESADKDSNQIARPELLLQADSQLLTSDFSSVNEVSASARRASTFAERRHSFLMARWNYRAD